MEEDAAVKNNVDLFLNLSSVYIIHCVIINTHLLI